MKKILCLIDVLTPGGAERQMAGLAVLLSRKGYTVDLITYYRNTFYLDLVETSGVKLVRLDGEFGKLGKFTEVYKIVKKEKYDCIIAYKDGPAMIGCLIRLFRNNTKLLVSERITTQELNIRQKIKFFLYRFADYIVPNSYSQEQFLKKNYPNLSGKVITITNFTDTGLFSPGYTISSNSFVVMTAARVARQKNIRNYLYAINKIKQLGLNIAFIWYGTVEEQDYKKECDDLVLELEISNMIEFRGPSKNIYEEYRKCDVFCLPSTYEGFPNVICEAMSCGKPIICSNVCDNPNIVENNKNGILFNPYNPNSIASAIIQICQMSQEKRLDMGMKNRQKAVELFSADVFVEKYISLLES